MPLIPKPAAGHAFLIPSANLALNANARCVVPCVEGSAYPVEFVGGVTATGTTGGDGGGTVAPTWAAGSFGTILTLADAASQEIHFAGRGNNQAGNITIVIVMKQTGLGGSGQGVPFSSGNSILMAGTAPFISDGLGNIVGPPAGIGLTTSHLTFLAIAIDLIAATATWYQYDYDAGSPALVSGSAAYPYGITTQADLILNQRDTAPRTWQGSINLAGLFTTVALNATQINQLLNDPALQVRGTLTSSTTNLVAGATGVSVPLVGNAGIWTPGTPGAPTFTETSTGTGSSITAQSVSGVNAGSVTLNNGTVGTATFTDPLTGATLAIPVTSGSTATTYTDTGPSTGTTSVPSGNFTLQLVGGTLAANCVFTPVGGLGGTFTPANPTILAGQTSVTYTYTAATNGAHPLAFTNNQALANPGATTYTTSAGALVLGATTIVPAVGSVGLNAPNASGGTAPLHYAAYGYDLPTATLGSGSPIGSTASVVDTPEPYGKVRFGGWIVTDSATPTPVSVQSPALFPYSAWPQLAFNFNLIGDSETWILDNGIGGVNVQTMIADIINSNTDVFGTISILNSGVSGMFTADWRTDAPNNVSLGYQLFGHSLTAGTAYFPGTGRKVAVVNLGTNDSRNLTGSPISVATYLANMSNIANGYLANGYDYVYLWPPTVFSVAAGQGSPAALQRQMEYIAALPSLANGTTIFSLPPTHSRFFANRLDLLGDGLHWTTLAGQNAAKTILARLLVAQMITHPFEPSGGGSAVFNPIGSGFIRGV
jgi:hypothetical protein